MTKKLSTVSFLIILVLVTLVGPVQAAGGVEVTLTPSQEQLAVGDPVVLTLQVTHPAGTQVIIPKLERTWGNFEVREQSPVTTSPNDDGTETTRQTITVTLFDLGTFETPTLPLTISDGSGQVTEATVPAVSLTVNPLRAEDDSTLRDIRPPADMALPSMLPALMTGLALAAVAAGSGWWIYGHWRKKNGLGTVVDNRPPYQVAYDELDRIAGLNLPAQSQFKAHYTLVTDCLRTYLEQQFDLHAFDRTTTELRLVLKQSTITPDHTRRFIHLFSESDLVKFAKVIPEIGEAHQLLDEARTLVTLTQPRPEPTNPEGFDQSFETNQSQKQVEVSA
jgi:hypothetical protein